MDTVFVCIPAFLVEDLTRQQLRRATWSNIEKASASVYNERVVRLIWYKALPTQSSILRY